MKLYRYNTNNSSAAAGHPPAIGRLAAVLARWQARARERQELARMSPHCLSDIDADWNTARREAAKPFWRT